MRYVLTLLLTAIVEHTHLDYLPKCLEAKFLELRLDGVLVRRSWRRKLE
jgi:hypothetical protein